MYFSLKMYLCELLYFFKPLIKIILDIVLWEISVTYIHAHEHFWTVNLTQLFCALFKFWDCQQQRQSLAAPCSQIVLYMLTLISFAFVKFQIWDGLVDAVNKWCLQGWSVMAGEIDAMWMSKEGCKHKVAPYKSCCAQ